MLQDLQQKPHNFFWDQGSSSAFPSAKRCWSRVVSWSAVQCLRMTEATSRLEKKISFVQQISHMAFAI
jgi:hypothetical protein